MKISSFRTHKTSSGNFAEVLDLKSLEKDRSGARRAVIFLHINSEYHERFKVWFPQVVTDDKGKKSVATRPVNLSKDGSDVISQLIRAIRKRKDIDNDEEILMLKAGKSQMSFLKGDIVGEEDYEWKKQLRRSSEVVMPIVYYDVKADKAYNKILILGYALMEELKEVLNSRYERYNKEYDEDPFPIQISYFDKKRGSDMYKAEFYPDLDVPECVEEAMNGDPLNTKDICEPESNEKLRTLLKQCYVYDEPLFEDEDDEDEDDEVDETEEKPKKASSKKAQPKSKPKQKKKDTEPCPECGKEISKDAEKCEHCGEEFSFLIECPGCKKDVEVDGDKCPECGEEIDVFGDED